VHDVSSSGATIYLEPLAVVELNNAWRELQVAEEQEVQRILAELSSLVAENADQLAATVEALAEIDLAFAKAIYAEDLDAAQPAMASPRSAGAPTAAEHHPGTTVRLLDARHPLLDPGEVVPIDVVLDDQTFIVIITGPNTGGKTVSLKTVGLLTVMAEAGLHIPAKSGSALSFFDSVYADIGDEQSIEQSLSTFSGHLNNILSFMNDAGRSSLVLLDELGAGTDPAEGAALARALLEHFRGRGVTTFVATHYPELKNYAQLTPGVANASVEFDAETLSPTYRLTVGLPGRSNAFAIAARLGLPRAVIEDARHSMSLDERRTEDMLADIHRLRLQMARARDEAGAARSEADLLSEQLRARIRDIDDERRAVIQDARDEMAQEIDALRKEIGGLRRRLRIAGAPIDIVAEVERSADRLGEGSPASLPEDAPAPGPEPRSIQAGDSVWVEPLNALGRVIEVEDGTAHVQVGPARTRVNLSALELRSRPQTRDTEERGTTSIRTAPASSPGVRVDLRGLQADDAVDRLDRHLDSAWRSGLPWVHIIHGKGTGVLRRSIRAMLREHPLVSSYEGGGTKEGGEGVTVARLVQR
jgi:DNA mismatch repair protein MutS2